MMRRFFLGCVALLLVGFAASCLVAGPLLGGRFRATGQSCTGSTCGPVSNTSGLSAPSAAATSTSSKDLAQPISQPLTGALPLQEAAPLTGVDRSTGVGKIDATTIGGVLIEKAEGRIGALELPEDAGKPYIVVVGPEQFQREAKEMLSRHKADAVFHVVCYTEDQWQVQKVGYQNGVWFTLARRSDGKAPILAFEENLKGKDGPLKDLIDAIRRPDGILDKKLLPALKRAVDPTPVITGKVKEIIGPIAGVGSLLLLLVAFLKP